MKTNKVIYWISTILMCAIFLFSALLYIFGHDIAAGFYKIIGFPIWILYPSAALKILGIIAILSKKSNLLKEWAYSGFFFDVLFATLAHIYANDHQYPLSVAALILVVISRIYESKLFQKK